MTDAPELLPCPFCGGMPRIDLTKKVYCQLHGDPSQAFKVYCYHDCPSRPSVAAGDIYNGGEERAKAEAIATWNIRADFFRPKVKELEWRKSHVSGWNEDWHTVPTGYTIRFADEYGWKWQTPLGAFGYEQSPEEAKAAAQADFERRIMECLL